MSLFRIINFVYIEIISARPWSCSLARTCQPCSKSSACDGSTNNRRRINSWYSLLSFFKLNIIFDYFQAFFRVLLTSKSFQFYLSKDVKSLSQGLWSYRIYQIDTIVQKCLLISVKWSIKFQLSKVAIKIWCSTKLYRFLTLNMLIFTFQRVRHR